MPHLSNSTSLTGDRYKRVRVKATGEIGIVALRRSGFGKSFYMEIPDGPNIASEFVYFEQTGEFRIYASHALGPVEE